MTFENTDFEALAREHKTPFYLYDLDGIVAHATQLRAHLPASAAVYYCIKANANRVLLEHIRPHVGGADLSSGGELLLAKATGWSTAPMSFAGPGKTVEELEHAVRERVGIISVESVTELRRLSAVAQAQGTTAAITIRVNPASIQKEFAMKMGGLPSQFGVSEELVDDVLHEALGTKGIAVKGIHIFSGTQCLEPEAILGNIRQTLELAEKFQKSHGFDLSLVNLGGGFGVPYFPGQEDMDHDALARSVGDLLREWTATHPAFADTRFILELGRYLVARFGVYVARVLDVKETRGKRFVILDGGMNHCFPATGNFGQLVKKNFPVLNLSRITDPERIAQEIVGPLCTPIDSMARNIQMPKAEIGDLVAFMNCGAYSYAASPILFLNQPTPPELVVRGGKYEVARPRRDALSFM